MKIDWRSVSHVAAAVVGQIVPGVQVAETLAWEMGGMRGPDKLDAVARLASNVFLSLQTVTGRKLAENARVDAAIRAVVNAVQALHQVIAEESAIPSS